MHVSLLILLLFNSADSEEEQDDKKYNWKANMAANISFQDAFKKVMNKKVDAENPVLSKYKKPLTEIEQAN